MIINAIPGEPFAGFGRTMARYCSRRLVDLPCDGGPQRIRRPHMRIDNKRNCIDITGRIDPTLFGGAKIAAMKVLGG